MSAARIPPRKWGLRRPEALQAHAAIERAGAGSTSAYTETKLDIVATDEPRVLRLVGELDLITCGRLEKALRDAGAGGLTLDLSELKFMDSMGIRVLLAAAKGLSDGEMLVLRHPAGEVKRVLEVAGLAQGVLGVRVKLDGSTSPPR